MKSVTKIFGSLSLITIFGFMTYFLYTCNHKKVSKTQEHRDIKQTVEQDVAISNTTKDSVVYHYLHGTVHATKTVAVGTKQQILPYYRKQINQAAKKSGIPADHIVSVSNVVEKMTTNSTSEGYIIAPKLTEFVIHDTCTKGFALLDSNTLHVHTEANIHIYGTVYWHKSRQLRDLVRFRLLKYLKGNTITEQDIYSDCPNVRIDSITSLQLIKR